MRLRLNTADRSFLLFAGLVATPYLLFFVVGCGLLTLFAVRVAAHGLGALTAGPGDLRPAAIVVALLTFSTALAGRSLRQQIQATRRLAAKVDAITLPLPDELRTAAAQAGLYDRVRLLDADAPYSFAYGLRRPRVAVSRGLLACAEPDEVAAVLAHERYHVRHRDPLKVVVARAASSAFFFMPALRGLRDRYAAASELAADRRAMRTCGRGALAGALYRVVRGPAWDELSTAAAIGGPDLLDVRLCQLESGREPPTAPVPGSHVAVSAAAVGLIAAVVAATLLAAGGGTPGGAMGSNGDMQMTPADFWWVLALGAGALVWRARRHRRSAA